VITPRKKLSHSKLFRKPILSMHPYAAPIEGRAGKDYLFLDFNERTIPPHPLILEEIKKYVSEGRLQMYPEYGNLNEVLADYVGVGANEVIPTVGGDQGIDIIMRAFVKDGDKVIIPSPTFAMFNQSANIQGADIISPRYKGDKFEFPFEEVLQEIRSRVKLVILCKPNNPTGTPITRTQAKTIVEKAASLNIAVLADEAYHEFAPDLTIIDLIDKYPNLFIIRTFAKTLGIPSLRAGLIVSQKQNIEELVKIRGPYDVNMVAVAAMKALRHPEVARDIKKYAREVMTVSKPMVEKFYKTNGIKFSRSVVGFHLLKVPGLYEFMKTKGIMIRPRSDPPGTVRASIGTKKDTERYLEAFSEFLKLKNDF